ncbi:MAG: RsfS/YbeB/iojap family protein, partial [Pyrinomonadaceae bacterium]|nr:RsfS/YbeB/iojap family protein [Phycisphaerales bacterium]
MVAQAPETLPNDGASLATDKPVRATADASRQFAIDVAKITANTRCTDVIILDVRGLSPVTDFLVLGTGTSGRQMR